MRNYSLSALERRQLLTVAFKEVAHEMDCLRESHRGLNFRDFVRDAAPNFP